MTAKITSKVTTETRQVRVSRLNLPGARGVEASIDGDSLQVACGFQSPGGRVQADETVSMPAYLLGELIQTLEALEE